MRERSSSATRAAPRKQENAENGQNSSKRAPMSCPGRCVAKKKGPRNARHKQNLLLRASSVFGLLLSLQSPLLPLSLSAPYSEGLSKSFGLVSLQWSLNDSWPTDQNKNVDIRNLSARPRSFSHSVTDVHRSDSVFVSSFQVPASVHRRQSRKGFVCV